MKQVCTMFSMLCFFLVLNSSVFAQHQTEKKRLNFYISVRTKKVDPAAFSAQMQARWQYLFRKKEFYCMFVESAEEMKDRIKKVLIEKDAMIGNIWFDSHGHFGRRRALFEIGKDEFNANSISDTIVNAPLRELAVFCDTNTVVGIGSCYGGATYTLPAIEEFPEQRMNGDTLMIKLGVLLNKAIVFGSESFVMTGPGIFFSGYTLAGTPKRKKFRDPIYKPVWEEAGNWNCYEGKSGKFYRVNTVTITRSGSIYTKPKNYLAFEKNKRKLYLKLFSFKQGNYNLANLYQE
jgi:hypothetical protein